MSMVRHVLATNEWQIQCPSCRQMVTATKAHVDGRDPLPLHSRWAPSWVQRMAGQWPGLQRSRLVFRTLIRLEWLARFLTRNYEPECLDKTPRDYSPLFPAGMGPGFLSPHRGMRASV